MVFLTKSFLNRQLLASSVSSVAEYGLCAAISLSNTPPDIAASPPGGAFLCHGKAIRGKVVGRRARYRVVFLEPDIHARDGFDFAKVILNRHTLL